MGQQSKPEHINCEAPGQFLRHYSPDIVSYLFGGTYMNEKLQLEDSVMLDFGGQFSSLKDKVRHYRDLSETGDCVEAIHLVYDFLRWAETKTDCSHVLLPDLKTFKQCENENEHLEALFDRLYRAASGKRA